VTVPRQRARLGGAFEAEGANVDAELKERYGRLLDGAVRGLDELSGNLDGKVAEAEVLVSEVRSLLDLPVPATEGTDAEALLRSLASAGGEGRRRAAAAEDVLGQLREAIDALVVEIDFATGSEGPLAVLRNTDPYDADPGLVDRAAQLAARYRLEVELERSVPLETRLKRSAAALERYLEEAYEELGFLDRQRKELEEAQ